MDNDDMAYTIGMLAALIIINKDRFEQFPEEGRAFFYTVLGAEGGEKAWHIYWNFLRKHKEENYQ